MFLNRGLLKEVLLGWKKKVSKQDFKMVNFFVVLKFEFAGGDAMVWMSVPNETGPASDFFVRRGLLCAWRLLLVFFLFCRDWCGEGGAP